MNEKKDTVKILFSLIRSGVCSQTIDESLLTSLSPDDVSYMYSLSKAHDVCHLVAMSLDKFGCLKDDEISEKYRKQLMIAVYRYERIEYEQKRIIEIFENNRIEFVLLKGAEIRKYYPEPWMRTSCDIDVLIHTNDTEKAISALSREGYTQNKSTTTYDFSLTSPSGVSLELHYSLSQDASILHTESVLERVWEECELKKGKSVQLCMSNEMFLFYHIVHMANHFTYGGCGIRAFIDLWLLNKNLVINKDKLYSLLDEANLVKFYEVSVELSLVWLEGAPHNETTSQMEHFVLIGGIYGSEKNSATIKAAKGESKSKSFLKIVFLPRKNLETIYPNLKKHPGLLPFYQIKRWFRIFKKDKRKRVKRMTSARNAVTLNEKEQTKFLIEKLGLIESK